MTTPIISFSFLTNLTEGFRIFTVTSISGIYALILYELFPQFLFDPNNLVMFFAIPVAAIAGILILMPRFLLKKPTSPKKSTENKTGDDLLNEIISGGEDQQTIQVNEPGLGEMEKSGAKGADDKKIGSENPELDALLGTGSSENQINADVTGGPISGLNEPAIHDMIDQKFEPVEKDLSSFKKDLNKIKEDMKITKENVDSLTESFEGTLTDMKAFQAEIANPLNFMRKYFESIDIKSLSDPSLPLRQTTGDTENRGNVLPHQPIMQPIQQSPPQQSYSQPPPQQTPPPKEPKPKQTEMEQIESGTDLDNPMDSVMKPLFSGNLSVSNLMAIVELAGEMLKESGDDCIDLLIEQCKLMGLKEEDEGTIYNIIEMLKKSDLNIESTLIQLYKFAKIVGINDKESDAHYSRLVATQRKNKEKNKLEVSD